MEQAPKGLLRLNIETQAFHEAADEGWLGLLHPGVTHAAYVRQLVTTYGFEAPLEAAFAYTPSLKLFVELRQRSRAGLIARDLLTLGLQAREVSELPQCLLAPFSGPIEGLGWMYVTERSTLLHDHVRRSLLAHLPDAYDCCAYVSAYDGVANARWNELGQVIDRVVRSPEHTHLLITSATTAFRQLIDWSRHATARARDAGT